MKKWIFRLVLLAILAGGAWAGYRAVQQFQTRETVIPTTKVRKGDVVVKSFTRGELRAVRSVTLTAPNLFGTVQVTRLAPLGAFAREKDLVVEFDDSEVNSRLEEKQLEIDQIDEQIKKAQADLAIRDNQDQVDLLNARYSVRRAELEVKRNELLSTIDAKKNVLNLEETQRRLKQLESDVKSRRQQAEAELAVLREKKNKALLELNRERVRLSQVKLLAPISGLVAVKQNRTGFMFPGMQIPDIREGDQIQPGIPVADILDISEMEIIARVGELDRANLKEGQEAVIQLDAIADKQLKGKIKSLSGTASANAMSFDPAKKFDVMFSVDMAELLKALGAKDEQIRKILATAEQNRKKPIAVSSGSMFSGGMPGMMMGGGAPGGGMPGGMGGGPTVVMQGGPGGMAGGPGGMQGGMPGGMQGGFPGAGGPGGFGGGGGGRPGGMGGFDPMAMILPNLPPDVQKKVKPELEKLLKGKKFADLSQEERREFMGKFREIMQNAGVQGMGRPRGEGGAPGATGAPGAAPAAGGPPTMGFSPGGPGGGPAGGGGRGGFGGMGMGGFGMGGGSQFSAKELENAKLPPPPEEDTQFDVLLRPGLLADVQIIVEKVPDALSVPMQAVFEKEGKPIVYVKQGEQFVEREIKPLKRSESVMIIASGVGPNDVIALQDPTAKKKDKKEKKEGAGGAMGALGGGK
jgi:hypothetical protein